MCFCVCVWGGGVKQDEEDSMRAWGVSEAVWLVAELHRQETGG